MGEFTKKISDQLPRRQYLPEDFVWTNWDAATVTKKIPGILSEKRERYETVKAVAEKERTFENTVLGIESSDYANEGTINAIELLMNVSPSAKVRDAARVAIEELQKGMIDIEYDETIYRALKEYRARRESLKGEHKKLFRDMLLAFKRMGFELDYEKRMALKENLKQETEFAIHFTKNINEYDDSILVPSSKTKGLPEQYLRGLSRDSEGNYIVTLKYPDYFPFMENARNAKQRKELADKNLKKGGEENMKLLAQILELREKNARLLGYANHADFRTEIRMAKNAKRVKRFLDNLARKSKLRLRRDMRTLLAYKKKADNPSAKKIAHYDVAYYLNQLRKDRFDINQEQLREYFPFTSVREGVFRTYETLFSIRFTKCDGYALWHDDAELYRVGDQRGEVRAYFILDLYPREGKYGHAAMFPIIHGRTMLPEEGAGYVTPLCAMVANFNKPTEEDPSLMDHKEVLTFFHEFGHVMHHCLTSATYASQSGTAVSRDFVEAPSQMFEYWGWDAGVLKMISSHYRTGEALPDSVIQKLRNTEHFMEGYSTTRQIVLALFDLALHTSSAYSDPASLYNAMVKKYMGIDMPDDAIFAAGFGHLMGYDAGYYGYLWSKVYAADMFTKFEKEGILNPRTGERYKKWILESGSGIEAMDCIRAFLGRNPSEKAFLKDVGIKKKNR